MHPMINIAVRAVRKAGDLIVKYYEMIDSTEYLQKGSNDSINRVHQVIKTTIIETINKFYPHHTFFTEKISKNKSSINQDIQWIINPLDGITNFFKRLPHFSVSVAVRIKGRTEVSVIYDPMRNELFTAARGQGAQLNGYRLRVSNTRDLNHAILAMGFPLRVKQYTVLYMNIFNKLLTECADFLRTGSTTLDLAYIAASRFDGCFEISLKPWIFIAGELIVKESGALVCDFFGDNNYILTGNIVAGNLQIVRAILERIRD